jgi:C-terminal processing protease CtpA/Prc
MVEPSCLHSLQIGIMFDGVEVNSMAFGGPAHKTGMLQKGDAVVKVNGEAVSNKFELHSALKKTEMPGMLVVLTVRRAADGGLLDIPITRTDSSELPDYHHRMFVCFTKLKVCAHFYHIGSCGVD